MAILGGLTDALYSRLSLSHRRHIWQSIQSCGTATPGSVSALQAAALKALGTLAGCPSNQLYPGRALLLPTENSVYVGQVPFDWQVSAVKVPASSTD